MKALDLAVMLVLLGARDAEIACDVVLCNVLRYGSLPFNGKLVSADTTAGNPHQADVKQKPANPVFVLRDVGSTRSKAWLKSAESMKN
ncbi:hypothetical protein PF008_g209 [Phytophthora fragariae]|uniref:Uncharacterized protein n=1 Tax=Phytophthora fragariae TaxID=53985 RepID=A0A6G0SNV3_9STRA|nr:hypothetical protein PF008_g209 [Phytophthora fragariae]